MNNMKLEIDHSRFVFMRVVEHKQLVHVVRERLIGLGFKENKIRDKDAAELRCNLVKKDMQVVSVGSGIAEEAARISHQGKIPMADALIMATAKIVDAECITDDSHFTLVKTRWI